MQNRVVHQVADVAPGDGDRQCLRFESRALAGRAWSRRHVLLQVFADELTFGLFEAPLDVGDDPLIVGAVLAAAPALALIREHDPLRARAIQDLLDVLRLQVADWRVHGEPVVLRHGLQQRSVVGVAVPAGFAPGGDGALGQAEVLVGEDQIWIDLETHSQTGTRRTRAMRCVEREAARLERRQRRPIVRTGEVLRIQRVLPALAGRLTDDHLARAQPQRLLDGVGDARFVLRLA